MNILDDIFGKKKENESTDHHQSRLSIPDFDSYTEFGQIISIFDYILNPNIKIAEKAAETIHRLFEKVKTYKSKQLYETFRYLRISEKDIKLFDRFENNIRTTLLCITTLNGNGYSREEALDKLSEIQTQGTIPFIFFRLADWVKPIRIKAEEIIKTFIIESNTIYFIQNHKLISWMLQVERNDLSKLHSQILNSITLKHLDSNDLNKLDDGERFFYFSCFAKNKKLDSYLLAQILTDKYYLVRMLLIKQLDKVNDPEMILGKLLSDKSQKVRQGAINQITDQNLSNYQTILETLIFDNSASVRSEARRLLNKIKVCDFNYIYEKSIKSNEHLVGAILGLSEVSDITKISLIIQFLESDRAKIKNASLIGIYNLDKDLAIEKAYQIIETTNPVSTKKTAETILTKKGIDISRIRILYDLTDLTGKKIILRLINKYGGWSSAGDFLKALTEENEEIQLIAKFFLEAWDRYTIRLATRQSREDKEYVLTWYKNAKELGIKVPDKIPFIFGEK